MGYISTASCSYRAPSALEIVKADSSLYSRVLRYISDLVAPTLYTTSPTHRACSRKRLSGRTSCTALPHLTFSPKEHRTLYLAFYESRGRSAGAIVEYWTTGMDFSADEEDAMLSTLWMGVFSLSQEDMRAWELENEDSRLMAFNDVWEAPKQPCADVRNLASGDSFALEGELTAKRLSTHRRTQIADRAIRMAYTGCHADLSDLGTEVCNNVEMNTVIEVEEQLDTRYEDPDTTPEYDELQYNNLEDVDHEESEPPILIHPSVHIQNRECPDWSTDYINKVGIRARARNNHPTITDPGETSWMHSITETHIRRFEAMVSSDEAVGDDSLATESEEEEYCELARACMSVFRALET